MGKKLQTKLLIFYIIITVLWILISFLVGGAYGGFTLSRILLTIAGSFLYVFIIFIYASTGEAGKERRMIYLTAVALVFYLMFELIIMVAHLAEKM